MRESDARRPAGGFQTQAWLLMLTVAPQSKSWRPLRVSR
jgi:hypothetical protein